MKVPKSAVITKKLYDKKCRFNARVVFETNDGKRNYKRIEGAWMEGRVVGFRYKFTGTVKKYASSHYYNLDPPDDTPYLHIESSVLVAIVAFAKFSKPALVLPEDIVLC